MGTKFYFDFQWFMGKCVPLEMTRVRELLVTFVAFVRRLSCVRSDVAVQVRAADKSGKKSENIFVFMHFIKYVLELYVINYIKS